jgi:predicted HTH transcriptional regulator
VRPIPSYHIYEGDVFQLIDQAVSFVMSRIDATVGGRDKTVLADVTPELPLLAVTEAIVNAVCHRDYTSNMSVQVMLFKDRLEIWNPGHLPFGLTTEMLKGQHTSQPANPLLAFPMYLYGSIEQMSTGTKMIVEECKKIGLPTPEFKQDVDFIITIKRNDTENEKTTQKTTQKTAQKTAQKILETIRQNSKITRSELAKITGISEDGIKWNLNNLKSRGILERVGADKGGYWKINENYETNKVI